MTVLDADQLGRFATALWEPDDLVEIRPLPIASGQRRWLPAREVPALLPALREENSRGANLYAGVLPRTEVGGGSAEHTDGGRVVWIDCDHMPADAALARVQAAAVPPPMLAVDSGHGAHVYWRLGELLPREAHTRLLKSVHAWLARDPELAPHLDAKTQEPARIMRLPGFVNHKPPAANTAIIHYAPEAVGTIEAWAEVMAAYAPAPEPSRPAYVPPVAPPNADRERRYALTALAGECRELSVQKEGNRNNRLNIAATKLGGFITSGALSDDEVRAGLTDAALAAGLLAGEIDRTLASGLAHGAGVPRRAPERSGADPAVNLSGILTQAPVKPGLRPVVEVIEGGDDQDVPPTAAFGPRGLPDTFYRIPGLVSDVMDFTMEHGPSPNPLLSFCGAVTLQAHLAGRKIRDDGDVRPNIYLMALANPSSGKDYPRKFNFRLLDEIGIGNTAGISFSTGEGLQDSLLDHPAMFYQTDEIANYFASLAKSKDGRAEAALTELLAIFTSSDGKYIARKKAKTGGADADRFVYQPSLTVLGTAPVEDFYLSLTPRILNNGLFARLVVIEAERPVVPHDAKIADIPERILSAARWWAELVPPGMEGNLAQTPVPFPRQITVGYTPEARDLVAAFRDETIARRNEASAVNNTMLASIWGRGREIARKFALLYAASGNRPPEAIDFPAADWAVRFAGHQIERAIHMAGLHVSENEVHAAKQRVLRMLLAAPDRALTKSQLTRKTQWLRARERDEILADLQTGGEIEYAEETTGGRSRMVYRLCGKTADG